jgi:hypothetical protein
VVSLTGRAGDPDSEGEGRAERPALAHRT